MTTMAARPAPADTPIIPGSANGFFNTPCNIQPAIAKFIPANIAVSTLGMRM